MNELIGKKVRRHNGKKWEEGIIVLDSFDGEPEELFIEYADGDREELEGLPYELI